MPNMPVRGWWGGKGGGQSTTPTPATVPINDVHTSAEATRIVTESMGEVNSAMVAALVELSTRVKQKGWLTTDLVRAALILGEEAGEVGAGALQCTRMGQLTMANLEALHTELHQVVSVALQMTVNVRRQMDRLQHVDTIRRGPNSGPDSPK